jgi:hypothetical protein
VTADWSYTPRDLKQGFDFDQAYDTVKEKNISADCSDNEITETIMQNALSRKFETNIPRYETEIFVSNFRKEVVDSWYPYFLFKDI